MHLVVVCPALADGCRLHFSINGSNSGLQHRSFLFGEFILTDLWRREERKTVAKRERESDWLSHKSAASEALGSAVRLCTYLEVHFEVTASCRLLAFLLHACPGKTVFVFVCLCTCDCPLEFAETVRWQCTPKHLTELCLLTFTVPNLLIHWLTSAITSVILNNALNIIGTNCLSF